MNGADDALSQLYIVIILMRGLQAYTVSYESATLYLHTASRTKLQLLETHCRHHVG